MKKVKLGFYAIKYGSGALCHGSSLVVTHDKNILRELAPATKGHTYQSVYLHHVLEALALGAEYNFDTSAFNMLSEHIELNQYTHTILNETEPTFHRIKMSN